MSLGIVTVGCGTDHGGKVISGSPTHTISGKPIARLQDMVDCPQKYPDGRPHGVNKIIEAHPTFTVGEIPVAVDGCHTECGCKLIASSSASVGD
ncbi:PAAR domain-containing protein [Cupriavidus oxalaticus]|uniref:PAAR domain-containing protein n=1 Tax=Cupriavidus oxalaticus TaxID=96344 RepID=UPI003F735018